MRLLRRHSRRSGEVTAISSAATGSDQPFALTVEDGQRLDGSLPGDDLFKPGWQRFYFSVVIDLRDALRANDTDAITATIDRLSAGVDQTASNSALIGARISSRPNYSAAIAGRQNAIREAALQPGDAGCRGH